MEQCTAHTRQRLRSIAPDDGAPVKYGQSRSYVIAREVRQEALLREARDVLHSLEQLLHVTRTRLAPEEHWYSTSPEDVFVAQVPHDLASDESDLSSLICPNLRHRLMLLYGR